MTLGPPSGRTDLRTFVACVPLGFEGLRDVGSGAEVGVVSRRHGALAESGKICSDAARCRHQPSYSRRRKDGGARAKPMGYASRLGGNVGDVTEMAD